MTLNMEENILVQSSVIMIAFTTSTNLFSLESRCKFHEIPLLQGRSWTGWSQASQSSGRSPCPSAGMFQHVPQTGNMCISDIIQSNHMYWITHTKATSDSRHLKWSAKFIQTDPQNQRKIVGVANSTQRLYETIVGAVCRSLEFLSACAPPLMTGNCGERVFWVPFWWRFIAAICSTISLV